MKEYVTYILYSATYKRIYIGSTSNLIQRFLSHNFLATKGYTKRYRPWIVVEVEYHISKKEAMKRERFLKSGVGRKFIHTKIVSKYK